MIKQYDGTFMVLVETLDGSHYRIRPSDIPHLSEGGLGLLSTFGKCEVEQRAERLVHFFVSRGRWCPFRLKELLKFYRSRDWSTANPFFGLAGAWFDDGGLGNWVEPADVFIASDSAGNFFVTDRFVDRCANAADRGPLECVVDNVVEIIAAEESRLGATVKPH